MNNRPTSHATLLVAAALRFVDASDLQLKQAFDDHLREMVARPDYFGIWPDTIEDAQALLSEEVARPIDDWHEDFGCVLWWRFPIVDPPYVGSPLDLGKPVEVRFPAPSEPDGIKTLTFYVGGWPGYHTHWTPLSVIPRPPKGAAHG